MENINRDREEAVYIIRFTDGSLMSIHGTKEEAEAAAERLKGSREIAVII